ncbi:PREDICTED: flap endonuclease GEN-like 2 isoform X2 [Lupinus angustifolius]|uniref:flap endonuclease GEN-like 2 isoform X2 n=1 Tax=Lupinus angustifolius TaxID=3871 RepID=UPI00092E2609|nr:PREDICTED: flap endonuclease GEN-like 2 isoform X2 [Lupinus angustifolius]
MGVKHLWDILESCKKTVPLHHLQNKKVCVDLSCWMVQLQNVNKSYVASKDKVYLRGLFHRLRALIALNCKVVFVSDGSIPAIKLTTYRQRLNGRKEQVSEKENDANSNNAPSLSQNDTNSQKVTSLRRNAGSEFSCMIKEAKVLGMVLGVSCLNGIEEAEAQCALLNNELLCDGCFSSDSDIFLFGARTVYRDICLGDGGYVVYYEMADIESKLGFGRNSLIALSLLLGSDYYPGVHGLGPETACQIVKSIGDKLILQKFASEGLGWVKRRKGGKNTLERDGVILQVINAYMKPKCHSADSDCVQRALAQYPFQQIKLQQICTEFFEWPSERTDGYILPNIAERDLRRFANLRLTSSEVGLNPPLHQIPVKCPVSEIIKTRKVQGKECYEVSWEEMDGLETSIVPAHLLQSACPEKISEFEEKKVQRKKDKKQNIQKRRPKKNETSELDLKLQNLLIDINFGDQHNHNASESDSSRMTLGVAATTMPMPEANLNTTELLHQSHDIEHNYWSQNMSNISSSSNAFSTLDKNEVIDLLSPSPPKQSLISSKFQQSSNQVIDVINLSDSEYDMSPEHNEKAKELRLFLASIRNHIH